tara:strand:- start:1156 stop:1269 length:114 start_codon:yes stop_codon:yes gene_type:complete
MISVKTNHTLSPQPLSQGRGELRYLTPLPFGGGGSGG